MRPHDFNLRRPYLREERDAMRQWLGQMHFTHFVTLASNNPMSNVDLLRRQLGKWDARSNREFLGKRWRKKPDERLNWIAFPEGRDSSPHWHLLLQVLPGQIGEYQAKHPGRRFERMLKGNWERICKSGTCDVQKIETHRVDYYVTKDSADYWNWSEFILFREFFEL